ncbi:NAC transcription factor 29-like [Dorcoceras hygrometricum]|uniref:NAC transcription factor 29-like n=1 Tax=Dorcoceras hygrometricum TaxID=472368 RepID=A0A2Z7C1H1_9LAMI|nr:NAC transcription factor 29-like [Dorcoceras hygrometricum]
MVWKRCLNGSRSIKKRGALDEKNRVELVKDKPAHDKQAQRPAMFKSRKELNKSSTDEVSTSSMQTRTKISWRIRIKLVKVKPA